MTTPSGQKRGGSFVGGLIPPSSGKKSSRALARTQKGHFYKPLPVRFRYGGFDFQRIAREGDAALYEQRRAGCAGASVCYEAIRVRRRDGFQIGDRFVEPAELYPASKFWGVDGFTFTNRNQALDKFLKFRWEKQHNQKTKNADRT